MNSDVNIRFLLLKDFSSFIVQIILFFLSLLVVPIPC